MPETDCSEIIYSENYRSYLIKYDNDLDGVYDIVEPDCVTIINNQFLVAYKQTEEERNIYEYGYQSLPKCFGLMDTAAVESMGVERVRNLPGLALTGRDVLIGFVDTGIDYTNPIFRREDNSTRIEYIWDQNLSGFDGQNTVFNYGREYTRADIERALATDDPYSVVPCADENGHGTFLASLACGGVDEANSFTGVAPESGLIVVKLKQAKANLRDYMLINGDAVCYGEDDIILGIKYLLNKAIELGRPLVVCLGLGSSQGDHEGNTNIELYINSLSNLRGVCVVAPVGNELGFGGHFAGNNRINRITPAENIEISVGENNKGFVMEIWGNAPGLLKIDVLSPTGERLGDISYVRNGRSEIRFTYEGSRVYVDNFVVDGYSGDQLYVLRFLNPTRGIWTINVSEQNLTSGLGFDAWLPISGFLTGDIKFVRPDPGVTICSPANARGIITAAGYNHTNNSLYINSGRGFTRKGRIKPDITAPAVNLYGAFAGNVLTGQSLFIRRSGSSGGAALLAGVAGLIMEWALVKGNNYGITTEVIRQMLIRGSRQVADIEYPSPSWGWGVIDIYETFNVIRNM